jgi:hypothetical protein
MNHNDDDDDSINIKNYVYYSCIVYESCPLLVLEENGANPGKPFLNAPSILLDDDLRPAESKESCVTSIAGPSRSTREMNCVDILN